MDGQTRAVEPLTNEPHPEQAVKSFSSLFANMFCVAPRSFEAQQMHMQTIKMFSRPQLLLLLFVSLLSLRACSADRLLRAAALYCSQVHPACTSCSVRRRIVDGLSFSSLICTSCEQPRYALYANGTSSTCGESLMSF
jgi:hypothetical protein